MLGGGPYHFFVRSSFSAAWSSIDSASSVASEMPCLRARSAVFAPASCSRRTAMICHLGTQPSRDGKSVMHLFRRRDDSAELALVESQFGKRFRTASEDSTRRRYLVSAGSVFKSTLENVLELRVLLHGEVASPDACAFPSSNALRGGGCMAASASSGHKSRTIFILTSC